MNVKNTKLRGELDAALSQLAIAAAREQNTQASQEEKFRLILAKVNTLDQELVASR